MRDELAVAESAGYNRAMREMTEEVARLQARGDQLTRELASLENRRKREVHAASERGRIYAAESASRWATARAEALRDAADHVHEIDGRNDDAAAEWLRARALAAIGLTPTNPEEQS